MSKIISPSELSAHNKPEDIWIKIDNDVYDMTSFIEEHPGGSKILKRVAGKDATKQFWKVHFPLSVPLVSEGWGKVKTGIDKG